MCLNRYVTFLFYLLLGAGGGFVFSASATSASATEESDSPVEREKQNLEKEELHIQKAFPQYRVDFNHKLIQEEVYEELLKELKEKEKSE